MSPATVIAEARTWVGNWDFIEIESVAWVPDNAASGLWWPPHGPQTKAKITFGWDITADGLWHEVFHSVATKAPLIALEGAWGEGWCCAFSDVMRQKFAPVDVTVEPGPDPVLRLYGFPATLLTDRAGWSAARLKDLWLGWNLLAKSGTVEPKGFSRFMGYDPELGRYV